jgi:general secretion pathway protein D
VQASTVNATNGPTTNKRTIESTVLVDDGSIVVLGGLLQDEYAGNQDKVPGLGDVPLFGHLFKNETRSRKKTNLMVFLRPVVVRDGKSSDQLSLGRYDQMNTGMKLAQPEPSKILSINDAATLDDVPAVKLNPGSASANGQSVPVPAPTVVPAQ